MVEGFSCFMFSVLAFRVAYGESNPKRETPQPETTKGTRQ